jgi:predicted Zn-ribbon and HTH transcriptional regulator
MKKHSKNDSFKNESTESGIDKLVNGYDTLMEQLSAWVEKADENAGPLLINGLHDAEEFMHGLGQWTKEEIDLLSRYVKRDIHDISQNLEKKNQSLIEWLQFDVKQVEDRVLEILSSMTDKTRVELDKIKHLAAKSNVWHTGEVTSVGTISCNKCGTELHYHKAGRIPPCPKCHNTEFIR